MKRIFLIGMLLMICLTGCGKEEKLPAKSVSITSVETFDVDMSHYRNMSSINHHFKGIAPETYFNLIRNNGSAIVYVGFDTCPVCNKAVSIMEEVAAELDVTIYYINCYDNLYPLIDYIDEFIQLTEPILDVKDGEPVVLTPHLITMVNGEFKDSWISIDNLDPENDENDYQKVYDRYKTMMEIYKVD